MKYFLLHPINHGFDNDTDGPVEVIAFEPDHLGSLWRTEYRFLRKEGASRRAARWHVHRMVAMIGDHLGQYPRWQAGLATTYTEEDDVTQNFRGACPCGWRGDWMLSSRKARSDADWHVAVNGTIRCGQVSGD